jgi:hypothetical protein
MLRNFGISLLFLGLLAAGIDGFRERSGRRTGTPETTTEQGLFRTSDYGVCATCLPR